MKELGRNWCAVGLVAATLVAATSCTQEPTTVKGVVTLDGRPLEIKQGMRGTVVFQPAGVAGSTFNSMIDSKGGYELAGGASTTVNPGVYWVAVNAVEIVPPSEDHPEPKGRRITPASYASAADSGFRVEVAPGPNVVNLDLHSKAEAEGPNNTTSQEATHGVESQGQATPRQRRVAKEQQF